MDRNDASEEILTLARALAVVGDDAEALRFLRDLATARELRELGRRLRVARLLDERVPYQQISQLTGASSATISRVAKSLRRGRGGYRLVLDRLERGPSADELPVR